MKTLLVLADGSVYEGESFGARGEVCGEVVFNTAMTGYQEVITDPSYRGQMVCFTYPHIGNYGVNEEDIESRGLHLSGIIVREYSRSYSNWRGVGSLEHLLARHGVIGLTGIDTRALTRRLRTAGAMTGIISNSRDDIDSLLDTVQKFPRMEGSNYVVEVSCEKPWSWENSLEVSFPRPLPEQVKFNVVTLDCGVKFNILRSLADRGCAVTVMPATARAEEILERSPHGLILSNGPGDPAALNGIVGEVRRLIGKLPIFGICLGHQLIGSALGGATFKLPFGHHGANHPVKNHLTGRVEITSQNHGFAVLPESLSSAVEITHTSLYDGTVEGLRHRSEPLFSVQYHPEASPGPHDSDYLFDRFIAMMEGA